MCTGGDSYYCKHIPNPLIQCGVYDTSSVTSPPYWQRRWGRSSVWSNQYQTWMRLLSNQKWVMPFTPTLPPTRGRSFWLYIRFRIFQNPDYLTWNWADGKRYPFLKVEHVSSDTGFAIYFEQDAYENYIGYLHYKPSVGFETPVGERHRMKLKDINTFLQFPTASLDTWWSWLRIPYMGYNCDLQNYKIHLSYYATTQISSCMDLELRTEYDNSPYNIILHNTWGENFFLDVKDFHIGFYNPYDATVDTDPATSTAHQTLQSKLGPTGSFSVNTADYCCYTTCTVCNKGQGTDGNLGKCSSCARGSYQSEEFHLGVCSSCGEGITTLYSGSQTVTDCLCSAGWESSDGGTSSCVQCESGKYSSVLSTCTECLDGSVAPVSGSSACDLCVAGKYSMNAQVCYDCQPGSYNNVSGSYRCYECPSGKVSTQVASTVCEECVPGKYAPIGTSSCVDCESGKFSNMYASTTCIDCALGTFSAVGSTLCQVCSAGKYTVPGTSSCGSCAPVNTHT